MNQRVGWVYVATILTCIVASNSWAQEEISPAVRHALAALQQESSSAVRTVFQGPQLTWLSGALSPPTGEEAGVTARRFMETQQQLLRISPALDFEEIRRHVHDGVTYLELQPRYQGLPILGATVLLSLRDGVVRHVSAGAGLDNLDTLDLDRQAVIPPERAQQLVEQWSQKGAERPDELAWAPLAGEDGPLLPIWLVRQRQSSPPRDWRYAVEATTGTLLWRADQFIHAEGFVYDTNPVVADGKFSRVELLNLESTEVLEGTYAQSFRCVGSTGNCANGGMMLGGNCKICGDAAHTAIADNDGNFLYEPDEPNVEDPFAEVHAYFHADRVARYFGESLSFPRKCQDKSQITVFVNHHVPGDVQSSANAFYGDADGDYCGDITLGEGLGTDFSYDADVIYHEYTHGVVEQAGGLGCVPLGICWDTLGLNWTPMGLNEGFADYFAISLSDDPLLGEHVAGALAAAGAPSSHGESLRRGDNDHVCPFDLAGESHYDGQIWAGFGWDLRQLLGPELADRLMMRVLLALGPNSGYPEAAAAVELVVDEALEVNEITTADRAEIDRLLGPEGRGIKDCERIVPLDAVPPGHHEEPLMLFTFNGITLPAGIQWSLATPRRAGELRFAVEDVYGSAEKVTVHVRQDLPVDVKMRLAGMSLALDFLADFVVDVGEDDLVLNGESDPPLVEEGQYYFALEYSCPQGCLLRVRGDVEQRPNVPPVAVAAVSGDLDAGEEVLLDGMGSHDPDGQVVAYEWVQIDGPEAILANPTEGVTGVELAGAGTYTFALTVTDDEGADGEDSVSLTIAGDPKGGLTPEDLDPGGCACLVGSAAPSSRTSWTRLVTALVTTLSL